MAAQFLTISKLSNIISMITLGQQSGILRVVRGQGPTREVGQIKFMHGQAVSALLGQLTGASALTVLQNWGECAYAFEELPPGELTDADLTQNHPGRPTSDPSFGSGAYGPPSGSWPAYSFPSTAPRTPPATPSQGYASNSFAGAGSQPGYVPQSPSGFPTGDGLRPPPTHPTNVGHSGHSQAGGEGQLDAGMLMLCPRRTSLAERVDQLPLDRRERMVLLLVDGQRNLSDLARLTRRTERELLAVLDYLAGLGLVELRR